MSDLEDQLNVRKNLERFAQSAREKELEEKLERIQKLTDHFPGIKTKTLRPLESQPKEYEPNTYNPDGES